MKNFLLLFAFIFSIGIHADVKLDNDLDFKTKTEIVNFDVQENFVNLSMDQANEIKFTNGSKISFKSIDETIKGNSPISKIDWFEEVTPIDVSLFKELHYRNIMQNANFNYVDALKKWDEDFKRQMNGFFDSKSDYEQKKEDFFVSKIKEYLPDFDINNISEDYKKKFKVYNNNNYNTSTLLLNHNGEEIRIITIVKETNFNLSDPLTYKAFSKEYFY